MEVPSESFHRSFWDSRTCYPRRAFIQKMTDDLLAGHYVTTGSRNPGHSLTIFSTVTLSRFSVSVSVPPGLLLAVSYYNEMKPRDNTETWRLVPRQ